MRVALETTRSDPVDHLDREEMILADLEAVFEDGHPDLIAAALNDVARARGAADPALTGAAGIDAWAPRWRAWRWSGRRRRREDDINRIERYRGSDARARRRARRDN